VSKIRQWPVKKVKLDNMNPAPYNPRAMDDAERAALHASMKRWGLADTITWNKRTGNIVGGHQRYDELLEDGQTEASVVVVDIPEEEEKALNVVLNSPRAQGHFTESLDALVNEVKAKLPDLPSELRLDDLVIPDLDIPDVANNPNDEWNGMPEFENEDQGSFRKLVVHFKSQEDVDAFAELLGQKVFPRAQYIWFPEDPDSRPTLGKRIVQK